jgi:hypothetical protein
MTKKTEVIVIHETVLQSWLIDASTFALFICLIGVGIFLDSNAMQWVGAVIGFLTMVGRFSRLNRLTIEQARARLNELEAAL